MKTHDLVGEVGWSRTFDCTSLGHEKVGLDSLLSFPLESSLIIVT